MTVSAPIATPLEVRQVYSIMNRDEYKEFRMVKVVTTLSVVGTF